MEFFDPPSGDPIEEYSAYLRREELLAKIDMMEDLANLYETEPIAKLREMHAALYQKFVGIHPSKRHLIAPGETPKP
jgi:hypothetical protein